MSINSVLSWLFDNPDHKPGAQGNALGTTDRKRGSPMLARNATLLDVSEEEADEMIRALTGDMRSANEALQAYILVLRRKARDINARADHVDVLRQSAAAYDFDLVEGIDYTVRSKTLTANTIELARNPKTMPIKYDQPYGQPMPSQGPVQGQPKAALSVAAPVQPQSR